MFQESNRIELKATLNDKLEKEVVAFLNNHEGGILYIGVGDDGQPIGNPDIDSIQLKIYYQERGFELNKKFADSLVLLTPEGIYNYIAYLLADENGVSIKVAKYAGTDLEREPEVTAKK